MDAVKAGIMESSRHPSISSARGSRENHEALPSSVRQPSERTVAVGCGEHSTGNVFGALTVSVRRFGSARRSREPRVLAALHLPGRLGKRVVWPWASQTVATVERQEA